jgi:hypothetical protein
VSYLTETFRFLQWRTTVGLAAVLEFNIRQPEPKPNKFIDDEVNNKKAVRYSSTGAAADSN